MSDREWGAAIALYNRLTHKGMDRRGFIAELTRLAGGAAAGGRCRRASPHRLTKRAF
jgi:hypothetical protein